METTDTGQRPQATAPAPDETAPNGALAWFASCVARESTPRDLENMRRWLAWMVAWAVLATPDPEWFGYVDEETSWFTLTQAALVIAAFVGVIATFVRYVRETDELNRRVQLTSLSVGFGAGFLASELGQAAINAGLIESVDVDLPVITMLVSYAIASFVITRRYR